MPSVISCVCWVKKGVSKEIPDQSLSLSSHWSKSPVLTKDCSQSSLKDTIPTRRFKKDVKQNIDIEFCGQQVKLTQDEIKAFLKDSEDQLKQLELGSPDEDVDMSTNEKDIKDVCIDDQDDIVDQDDVDDQDDIDRLYGLDHYDSDDDIDDGVDEKGVKVSGAGMGNSLVGLTYYSNDEDDPYITLKKEDNDSDTEDFKILPTDNLLLVGRADEEYSCIEVKVYSEATHHSYNHHEIMLNAYPLCLEWMDYNTKEPDGKGSFVAVGTMLPMIEIWNLDLVDAIEPVVTLGSSQLSKKKKKTKKVKFATDQADSHTDAVMCLSWNKLVRSILASGSADCSVAVWDLSQGKCVVVIPHPDKVQSLSWHHYEPHLLATGCFDKFVRMFDCSGDVKSCIKWKVSGEVEKILWNHFIPNNLLVSTEDGVIHSIDRTQPDSKLFTLNAHDSSLSDFSLSCFLPGLLATVSHDKTVKCWDIKDNKPVFLFTKDLHMGALYCCNFCVDVAHTLAVGGATGELRLMNLQQIPPLKNHFLGENLLQPQIRDSISMESDDFDQNAEKDTTKSCVKEQSSHTIKTKHISHKKKKHKKRYH